MAAIVTAIGGGLLRDVLLGIHPSTVLTTWWYAAVSTAVAVLVFSLYPRLTGLRLSVEFGDALGLAAFSLAGAARAVEHGLPIHLAGLIGMVNGVGGGMLRDMMLGRVPFVLREEIYALPAMGGSLLFASGIAPEAAVAGLIVGVRMAAVVFKWKLPTGRTERRLPESDLERTMRIPRYTPTHDQTVVLRRVPPPHNPPRRVA
ncbi:membrane protein [Saccharothrix coeruleofusca]|uniref:Membrane protein n=1 Tax=Saccharothrix coeruleofusca TaxID=33919 RepID=A0A918ECG3_9PSEU|nr:membrane protein [Saccharothrix coeruleofusca]